MYQYNISLIPEIQKKIAHLQSMDLTKDEKNDLYVYDKLINLIYASNPKADSIYFKKVNVVKGRTHYEIRSYAMHSPALRIIKNASSFNLEANDWDSIQITSLFNNQFNQKKHMGLSYTPQNMLHVINKDFGAYLTKKNVPQI